MTDPYTDIQDNAEQLLRAWFHWWENEQHAPPHLPQALHVRTAAYLAARAIADGRKIYGPRDL